MALNRWVALVAPASPVEDRLIEPVVELMRRAVADGELAGDADFLAWCFLGLTSSMAPIPEDVAMPPGRRGEAVHRGVRAVVDLFLDGARPR